jgi:rsbT co-antagonist protein RsbR
VKTPDITDEDRRGFRLFWELNETHKDALNDGVLKAVAQIPAFGALLSAMTPEMRAKQEKEGRERQRLAMLEDNWQPYLEDARTQGQVYARMGLEFSAWFELLRVYRVVAAPLVRRHFKDDVEKIMACMHGTDRFIDIAMSAIGEAYLEAKQSIITSQSKAIRELSTPVLQVKPRLLIVPLVGVIDTERARQITENLLHGIRQRRARAVVLDITGVPIVDSKVASHLMQTVYAARLMGAEVVVSGISPEIAQTLVTLGADLGDARTVGDLEDAILVAEAFLRRTRAEDASVATAGVASADTSADVTSADRAEARRA